MPAPSPTNFGRRARPSLQVQGNEIRHIQGDKTEMVFSRLFGARFAQIEIELRPMASLHCL